ncbi:BUD32 [Candida oxycetoniae]|uniref:EKC/KEOPS complex subunit BUD32 n=1 Tax=Candida oxycetoniae TaxID=497107 RepID=A0AAI9SWK2_9ASCO|nr:BUD32 [Candida oxycetoniae]KAI3404084.2 BUD32 [Candida oxycetoniae]
MTEPLVRQLQQYVPNIEVEIVSQGAEALVFQTSTHPYIEHPFLRNQTKFIIKYRPSKPYRHPKIDAQITKSRTIGEAKFMCKLSKLGIQSPSLISCDFPKGIIWMEYLGQALPNGEISSFKNWLWYLEKHVKDIKACTSDEVEKVCFDVGVLIGRLHLNDMVHGDLTSSNILLQPVETENQTIQANKVSWEPALIDFGLSSFSGLPEDKAVDLYVLERAVDSTHSDFAKRYNEWLLKGYEKAHNLQEFEKFGKKKHLETIKRLEEVRLRELAMEAQNRRVDATLLKSNQNKLVRIIGKCESYDTNTYKATLLCNGPVTLDLSSSDQKDLITAGKYYEIVGKISNNPSDLKIHVYSVIEMSDNLNINAVEKLVSYCQKVPELFHE